MDPQWLCQQGLRRKINELCRAPGMHPVVTGQQTMSRALQRRDSAAVFLSQDNDSGDQKRRAR
jgi:hypothetical protein